MADTAIRLPGSLESIVKQSRDILAQTILDLSKTESKILQMVRKGETAANIQAIGAAEYLAAGVNIKNAADLLASLNASASTGLPFPCFYGTGCPAEFSGCGIDAEASSPAANAGFLLAYNTYNPTVAPVNPWGTGVSALASGDKVQIVSVRRSVSGQNLEHLEGMVMTVSSESEVTIASGLFSGFTARKLQFTTPFKYIDPATGGIVTHLAATPGVCTSIILRKVSDHTA